MPAANISIGDARLVAQEIAELEREYIALIGAAGRVRPGRRRIALLDAAKQLCPELWPGPLGVIR